MSGHLRQQLALQQAQIGASPTSDANMDVGPGPAAVTDGGGASRNLAFLTQAAQHLNGPSDGGKDDDDSTAAAATAAVVAAAASGSNPFEGAAAAAVAAALAADAAAYGSPQTTDVADNAAAPPIGNAGSVGGSSGEVASAAAAEDPGIHANPAVEPAKMQSLAEEAAQQPNAKASEVSVAASAPAVEEPELLESAPASVVGGGVVVVAAEEESTVEVLA